MNVPHFVYLGFVSFIYLSSPEDTSTDLLEREEGEVRDRGTSGWQRNIDWLPSVLASTRDQTCNLGMCLNWGMEPATFRCIGCCCSQLSHPARAIKILKRYCEVAYNTLLLLPLPESWPLQHCSLLVQDLNYNHALYLVFVSLASFNLELFISNFFVSHNWHFEVFRSVIL